MRSETGLVKGKPISGRLGRVLARKAVGSNKKHDLQVYLGKLTESFTSSSSSSSPSS